MGRPLGLESSRRVARDFSRHESKGDAKTNKTLINQLVD